MHNMELYEKFKGVPDNAKKQIQAGRMKGFTDINPMWRIKKLTEAFGPCGFGWYIDVIDKRLEWNAEQPSGEVSAFVDINLYVKMGDEWSKPIFGTGGSAFVSKERNGLYQSDECFKMALTDAISVACKNLGIGADVYWDADRTKYTGKQDQSEPTPEKRAAAPAAAQKPESNLNKEVVGKCMADGINMDWIANLYNKKSVSEMSATQCENALNNWDKVKQRYQEEKE